MPYTVTLHKNNKVTGVLNSDAGVDIRSFLGSFGVFLDSPCGGRGKCGKCTVKLSENGEAVKACVTIIDRDLDIYLPDDMDMEIAGDIAVTAASGAGQLPASPTKLGVAIDIGTTTVVAHLHDLETGERIATKSGVNAQRAHGADVVSRIEYSTEHGHGELTRLIQTQIAGLISDACASVGAQTTNNRTDRYCGKHDNAASRGEFRPLRHGNRAF